MTMPLEQLNQQVRRPTAARRHGYNPWHFVVAISEAAISALDVDDEEEEEDSGDSGEEGDSGVEKDMSEDIDIYR